MGPSPMPNGMSALWHASAAFRCASQGQASISGVYPTFSGCIAVTSMPAAAFNTLMRAHGGFACAPQHEGTAIRGKRETSRRHADHRRLLHGRNRCAVDASVAGLFSDPHYRSEDDHDRARHSRNRPGESLTISPCRGRRQKPP